MIELIFEMLALDEHYNQSELIEIAKGKYSIPETPAERREQNKRKKKWQK